jgi:hypothetical protein
MPKGPKGEKRPADVIGNAVKVMRIAVGDEVEIRDFSPLNHNASALGRKGGQARAKSLTEKERSDAAQKAALVRWGKKEK